MRFFSAFCLVLIGLAIVADAHTWLDCVKRRDRQNSGGRPACDGYPRGYPGRRTGVNLDVLYTYRIQPGLSAAPNDIPICEPNRQGAPNYTPEFPMAHAFPGETLLMSWTPNGHQRPAQNPRTSEFHWTGVAGTQLQRRGDLNDANRLGAPQPFDADCTGGAGDDCFGSLTIPPGTPSGTYSFVWYWVFNRDPNGAGEEYTTCFDVQVGVAPLLPTSTVTNKPHREVLGPEWQLMWKNSNDTVRVYSTKP